METAIAVLPDTKVVDAKALTAIERAKAFLIDTKEDYINADTFCSGLLALEKEIKEAFREAKQKADQAHKAVVAAEQKQLIPVNESRRIVKSKMAEWQEVEGRRRHEEEARLQAEARKKAEEAALLEAEALEKNGDKAGAEAVINTVEVPTVIVPKDLPKASTIFRTVWSAEITNPEALFRAVVDGKAPRNFLTIDESAIRKFAAATAGSVDVPGVRFFSRKA